MLIADLPGDGLAPRRTRPNLRRGDGTANRVKPTAHLCSPDDSRAWRLPNGYSQPTWLPKRCAGTRAHRDLSLSLDAPMILVSSLWLDLFRQDLIVRV